MNYYIADMHLGHANIMKHSNRPFSSVDEMDEYILNNFKHIKPDDHIYFLGDICMNATDKVIDQINKINGYKHLIIGNHDRKPLRDRRFRSLFDSIHDYSEIYDNGRKVILCHYPIIEWNGFFRGSIHLYGHIHNNDNKSNQIMKMIDNAYNVGVDYTGFSPRTLDEIIKNNYK